MKQFPASAIFVWSITYQKDIIEHILEYTLSKIGTHFYLK